MIGLVKKDFLVLRKVLKSYIVILVIMMGLSAFGIYAMSFVTSFISVMVMMLPISSFAYDKQAQWDSYAAALPVGRRAMVGARYLFALLVVVCVGSFALVSCVVDSIANRSDMLESIGTVLGSLGVAVLIADIMLPLNYKLGPERARPYLYGIVFIPLLLLAGAWKLGLLDHLDLSFLETLPDTGLVALGFMALIPLAALLGMVVSFLISCGIMKRKEF